MKRRIVAILLVLVMLMPTHSIAKQKAEIEISQQPCDIEAPLEATGFARVEAEGEGEIAYRWFWWDEGEEEWIDTGETDEDGELLQEWEGFDTDTLYVPVTEDTLGMRFLCVLTDENGDAIESDVVTVLEGRASTDLTIETQPEDILAEDGETATAFVEIDFELPEVEEPEEEPAGEEAAEEGEEELPEKEVLFSYKWLAEEDGEWIAVEYEGFDSPEICVPVSAENDGQSLKCLVRSSDGGEAESDVITVRMIETEVPEEPAEQDLEEIVEGEVPLAKAPEETPAVSEIAIVTQPSDIIAEIGQTGTATVEAESEAELSYQWYFRRGSSSWQASGFAGNKTNTISVPVAKERIGQQYKCVITTEDGAKVETDVVTVYDRVPSEIVIVTQPEDIRAKIGEKGSATVEAESEAELSYQWYFRRGEGSWQASGFEGCKTDTISVPVTSARIGQQYKCVITTEDGGRVETDVVTVMLPLPAEITIVAQPEDLQAHLGEIATATVEAESEAELSYRWYFRRGEGSWQASGFEGCRTNAISVPVETSRVGQQYKCVITAEDGTEVETDVITVLKPLASEISIDVQPADIQARLGEIGTATVEASSNAELSYRWYFKAKNSETWQPSGFEGCRTNAISVPVEMSRVGQQYKCVITTKDGGEVETDAVTVLAPLPSEITIDVQPTNMYGAIGENASATVEASADTGARLSYQWYFKAKGSDEWKASGMTGNKKATIVVPVTAARIGQQYKCVITTADGGFAETEPVTICEKTMSFTITSNPDSYRAYQGAFIELAVSASEGGVSYQWYKDGEALEGATENRLYFSSVTLEDAGEYYCVVSGGGCTAVCKSATVVVFE